MTDQLQRTLHLMQVLKRNNRPMTVSQLHDLLSFQNISERTLLRDLNAIEQSKLTNLECNDSQKPYQWSMTRCLDLAGLSNGQALGLVIMEQYLKNWLPTEVCNDLSEWIEAANRKLQARTANPQYVAWVDKIVFLPDQTQAETDKRFNRVRENVLQALFNDQQMLLTYRSLNNQETVFDMRMPVNPLGLVQQGQDVFMVAAIDRYRTPVLMALARIDNERVLATNSQVPDNFALKTFIARHDLFSYLLDHLQAPRQKAA